MDFEVIENPSLEPSPFERIYIDNHPKSRALLVIHEDKVLVLDYIGPDLDYIFDTGMLSEYFDATCDRPQKKSGVLIWMVVCHGILFCGLKPKKLENI
jgi:hypothetical protein